MFHSFGNIYTFIEISLTLHKGSIYGSNSYDVFDFLLKLAHKELSSGFIYGIKVEDHFTIMVCRYDYC